MKARGLIVWAGCAAAACALASLPERAAGSLAASDNAGNSAYNDGWQSGDNGGSGWSGGWTLSTTSGDGGQNGFFTGSSDINTGGRSWGTYANSGQTANAVRSLSGDLLVGQTFSLAMDNGSIQNGGTVGFGLRNSGGQNLFEFYFVGGSSFYRTNSSAGSVDTAIGFTNQGLSLAFVLTDANSFSFTIDRLSNGAGVDDTVTGDLIAQGDLGIEQVRLFNANAGSGGSFDAFFNSVAVASVPETSAFLLGGMVCGVAALGGRRRWLARSAG